MGNGGASKKRGWQVLFWLPESLRWEYLTMVRNKYVGKGFYRSNIERQLYNVIHNAYEEMQRKEGHRKADKNKDNLDSLLIKSNSSEPSASDQKSEAEPLFSHPAPHILQNFDVI